MIGNGIGNEVSNALVGDGYCNDEMNTAECNFDGGDCCGHCEIITITLENNAKAAQSTLEGTYHNLYMVNGKPSWTSASNAIWNAQENWHIGNLDNIGEFVGDIHSSFGSQCPFDLLSEMWYYYDTENGWTNAGANEIKIDCLKGNYHKIH